MVVRTWLLLLAALLAGGSGPMPQEAAPLSIWAERMYPTYENPLHSEITVNGTLVNIFTSDAVETLPPLKTGWNTLVMKTTVQEPTQNTNGLTFRIGPGRKDPQKGAIVMNPVLWQFRNETDWRHKGSAYSHPLGPSVKEVTVTYNLYYAGLDREAGELKAGDYVLRGKGTYPTFSSPVVGTVFVNGTPLNTFTSAPRDVIITSLLKPGRNEIRIVSGRVPNIIATNDIEFSVSGPAEWEVSNNRYTLAPIAQFKAMQGWQRNPKTGQLVNPLKAEADTIERVIPFMMKPPAEK